jgi:hypothetical protein
MGSILITLKELHNVQLFLPIVLTLKCHEFNQCPVHVSIFPAFYSVDRRAAIPQVLAQSFYKDRGDYKVAGRKVGRVYELSIYLIESSDIPSICALAKDMPLKFIRVKKLNLFFERRCVIVSFLFTVDDYDRT